MTPKAILPYIGFGNIKFGMEEHEVSSYLGDPDETEVQDYGEGAEANVLYFDEMGISMSFDKEADYKLVEISFENDKFILYDKIKVGMSKEDFLAAVKELKMEDYEMEDMKEDGFDDKELYTFEKENINIWLDEEAITSIQIGPEWVDDETIRWPERSKNDED
ncbi:hypothetical protein KDU71_01340 [Carboxylicivirga sediminis]|uniref:Uncharacterized protein n=1 Tax=Carboxylicivirga sediminis TaxID=2006564 RepID=A0A941F086_9BACT|nr:hypothetical protein [Carboxylicivirga sediminis]MBR8534189.1 hypothetical protein [Carboxylicivirga sediminis]